MSIVKKVQSQFLLDYLQYTENTEPPKIFHIWAALSGIAACLGRRCWIETGMGKMYPNMYILLIGPPGTRKSTAMNNIKKLIAKNTAVRLAPKDTAGQRQGLITAMQGAQEDTADEDLLLGATDIISQVENLNNFEMSICKADRHALYVCSSEFRSFLGQNNLDLTGFLLEMWDGEDYDYQLKTVKVTLQEPLLNLIGCTTSTEIATLLPPQVIGQGFMSRFIIAYSAEKYKQIPPSRVCFDKTMKSKLEDIYSFVSSDMRGAFTLSKEAEEMDDNLYMKGVEIHDNRFIYYIERRHTHLLKIACCLAASSKRKTIEACDLKEADMLLTETEMFMPEALGEFGLSPIAQAKQKMTEYIRHAKSPITNQILWIVMQRDMKLVDFSNSLSELINAKKIQQIKTSAGLAYVYNDNMQKALDNL
mgnify:CR=1 FL=1